ncbi:MAG TPA: DUF4190 domain-containing protein [Glycomyces sp.]|nr:DUF4190 domain-containing protein [Glycomyces sp.]
MAPDDDPKPEPPTPPTGEPEPDPAAVPTDESQPDPARPPTQRSRPDSASLSPDEASQQYPPPPYPPQHQYPYPPPPYGYARPGTDGFAITALVLGIVGLCACFGFLGIIFGNIAKRRIAESGRGGEGMATAGIVLGWVSVTITLVRIITVAIEYPGI